MNRPIDLWVTDRCAHEDLGLERWPDAEGVAGVDHPAARKLRAVRVLDPEPAHDHISGTRALFKLRVGADRGATWFDRERHMVFLVAYGEHRSGAEEDFYQQFREAGREASIMPTAADYDALDVWLAGRWLRELRDRTGPELIAAARTEPEAVFERDLGRCRARLITYEVDGDYLYELLLEQDEHAEDWLTPRQMVMIAAALFLHTGRVIERSPSWNGIGLTYFQDAFVA